MLRMQCIHGNSHCVPGPAQAPQQHVSYAWQVPFPLKNLTVEVFEQAVCNEIL